MTEQRPRYDTSDAPNQELPGYVSCKPVWALKITAMTDSQANGVAGSLLHFEDHRYGARFVAADWVHKRGAQAGGWLVQYEDGYLSWSPDNAFANGHVPAERWGFTRMQEPKYTIGRRGQLVNRRTGRQLPPDEPLFVLRGQDIHAMDTLTAYRASLPPGSTARDSVDERLLAFASFRRVNPERMKEPTGVEPLPPEPHTIGRWAPGEREGT